MMKKNCECTEFTRLYNIGRETKEIGSKCEMHNKEIERNSSISRNREHYEQFINLKNKYYEMSAFYEREIEMLADEKKLNISDYFKEKVISCASCGRYIDTIAKEDVDMEGNKISLPGPIYLIGSELGLFSTNLKAAMKIADLHRKGGLDAVIAKDLPSLSIVDRYCDLGNIKRIELNEQYCDNPIDSFLVAYKWFMTNSRNRGDKKAVLIERGENAVRNIDQIGNLCEQAKIGSSKIILNES